MVYIGTCQQHCAGRWERHAQRLLAVLAVWFLATSPPATADRAVTLVQTLAGHSKAVISLAQRARDGAIVTGSADKRGQVWNWNGTRLEVLHGHGDWVTSIAFMSNDSIVTGCADRVVRLWRPDGTKRLNSLPGHTGRVWAVAVTNDDTIVSTDVNGVMKLWRDGVASDVQAHQDWVSSVAVDATTGHIITGSGDATVKEWQNNAIVHRYQGHGDWIRTVAARDGIIASGSDDMTVRVWSNSTALATLTGHTDKVRAVAILSNGWIVSGSDDGVVKVWAFPEGTCQATVAAHTGVIWAITALTPPGSAPEYGKPAFGTASADKSAKFWVVEPWADTGVLREL